jgi:glutamate/tyrosine decarboxylase-like PLP-dependent enzyme
MHIPDWQASLDIAHDRAGRYLAGLPDRAVRANATMGELRAALGGPLPEQGEDPRQVIAELAERADPGLLPTGSGRFFGWVFGGALPAALAADWLTSAWDQNAFIANSSPAAAAIEAVAAGWLTDILGLPADSSVGFVTGTQMAHVTALAAARGELLRRRGWDVERSGLAGAPPIRVLAGAERHSTIDRAVRLVGLGTDSIVAVEADGQGRMTPAALRAVLRDGSGPTVVCAQLGNVNTGAQDPVGEICDIAADAGAWVHVDGAFGMWAAASPALRPLVAGLDRADSWATDAHKWLNVPYDSGLIFCAHPAAHRAAMSMQASYFAQGTADERDPFDYNPEASRRARGLPIYAALKSLGRTGVAELVERGCALAQRFAARLAEDPRVEVLNEVVLNQVLVRFIAPGGSGGVPPGIDTAPGGDHDAYTRQVLAAVQRDGTCWMTGTTWHGMAAMRISVSNWSTDEADVDRSVEAVLGCLTREPS